MSGVRWWHEKSAVAAAAAAVGGKRMHVSNSHMNLTDATMDLRD